jgi:DNA-binding NtrC family response regulator
MTTPPLSDVHALVTMAAESAILLIGPAGSRQGTLRDILAHPRWEIREVSCYGEAVGILNRCRIAVTICDTDMEDGNWQSLLADLQGRPEPPNLIVSSRLADERLWAEVLNLGGYDVLQQPFDGGEVLRVTGMAWADWHERWPCRTGQEAGTLRARSAAF